MSRSPLPHGLSGREAEIQALMSGGRLQRLNSSPSPASSQGESKTYYNFVFVCLKFVGHELVLGDLRKVVKYLVRYPFFRKKEKLLNGVNNTWKFRISQPS